MIPIEKKFDKEKFESSPEFFKKIDWSLLRSQKTILLAVIDNPATSQEDGEGLEGLLVLIDALQDYAVDEIGIPEMDIFDFEDEENRKG